MLEEPGAKIAIPDGSETAPAGEIAEGGTLETGAGIDAPEGKAPSADGFAVVDELRPGGVSPENRQPEQGASPDAPSALLRAVAGALHAVAGQMSPASTASAGDEAALAEAFRTFLDAFAGQNAPTRSEFRDLAARLDRLTSQYKAGR